jgi:vitamin B12 transporter
VEISPDLDPLHMSTAGVRNGDEMTPRTIIRPWLLALACWPGMLPAGDEDPYQLKPDLVVTPSRMVESLSEALASVTVITRDDIDRSAAPDLLELLRLQPGVDIVRSGGPGSQTSIFLRGSNSNHALVMIDGVRAGSANTGAYVWEQLPANQIERIEIVRGPRGSLYGSDSIGGVIQVFTRSSPDPYARLTAGSFETIAAEGGLGYQGERTRLSLNAGYRDVGGFSAQNVNGFSYDPDDDGFRTVNLGFNGSTEGDRGRLRYSALVLDNESEFDQGTSDSEQMIASLEYQGNFSARWDYQLRGGYIRDDLLTDFGFFSTEFKSRRYEIGWQNQLTVLQQGTLNFGLDFYRDKGSSDSAWNESRDNAGLFVNFDRYLDALHLQLGGRIDDNSRFGTEFTGQIAAAYELGTAWQIMGSYGTAFRGPNLNEQFSPGFGGLFAGNPDLRPESSASAELGLRWQGQAMGEFSAAVYQTDVDDLISFTGEYFQAINVDRARLRGLELSYGLEHDAWLLNAGATLQDTEDLTSGQPLLRRPEHKASITLDRRFGTGSWAGVEWFYSGERPDFGGITLESYHLFNLRAGWAFRPAWRFELRGENLMDEDYEPAYGFNPAGRSWFLSLSWMP